MKKRFKLLLVSAIAPSICGFLAAVMVFNNVDFDLNKAGLSGTENWIHYPSVEPTKSQPGIREYYVDCASHAHTFDTPSKYSEGSWTSSKKSEIYANPNDDRYIKSFDEVDGIMGDIPGTDPYNIVKIKEAQSYITANYSLVSQASYKTESNKVFEYEEAYLNCNTTILEMSSVSYYANNPAFAVSRGSDGTGYGNTIEVAINSTFSSNPAFEFTNMSYFSSDYSAISIAVYSSEATKVTFGVIYDNYGGGGSYLPESTLEVGWNVLSFPKNSTAYNLLTTSPDGSKQFTNMHVVLTGPHNAGNSLKIASFIGYKKGSALTNKIAKLPSPNNLTPYSIGELNKLLDEYNNLSSVEKSNVSNLSVLNNLISVWNDKYIVLYDMNESYADFTGNCVLQETKLFESNIGYTRLVEVTEAGTYIDINNIDNAYTDISLSKIVYKVKPNTDCFMSWSQIGNYGRREWEGSTRLPDMIMHKNVWNDFEVNGTISGVSAVTTFMTYFNEHTSTRNDFTVTSDRWNGYLAKTAGFAFQMSSIIGVKDNSSKVSTLISKIEALPEPSSVSVSSTADLNEIDTLFEELPTESKELVTNIDKFYKCQEILSYAEPYVANPSLKLDSPWQTTCVPIDGIQKNVPSKYGKSYYFTTMENNWGLGLRLFTGVLPVDDCDFFFYVKNYSKTIVLGHDAYGTEDASAVGVSAGEGWYKYSFSASAYQQLQANIKNYMFIFFNPKLPASGVISAGTEIYISGIFKKASSDPAKKALVQTEIDSLISSEINEFSLPSIAKVQKDIFNLSTFDQGSLANAEKVGNLYQQYNANYQKAYSLNVYSVGKYSSGSCGSVSKEMDSVYGDIFEISSIAGYNNVFTLGNWQMSSSTGNFRGKGRAVSPLEAGKYLTLKFAFYSSSSTTLRLYAYSKNGLNVVVLDRNIMIGWNIISLSSSEINILSSGSFTGLSFSLGTISVSGKYKLSSFIGRLNPSFTGEDYHYAQTSVHENTKNVESSNTPFVLSGHSLYRINTNQSSIAAEAIGFFEDEMFKATKVTFEETNSLNPSRLSRHIYFDNATAMSLMGIDVPSISDLGETGYVIKTVGTSIYVFAYSPRGYRLASIRLLETLIGYDYLSNDLVTTNKNGQQLNGNEIIYLPSFNIKEIPDYDVRYASNSISYADYGSGLDNRNDIYHGDRAYIYNYLPTDKYGECYYDTAYDPIKKIHGEVVCFNAKGNQSLRRTMIKVIGDQVIKNAKEKPEDPYQCIMQGDSAKHCDCATCQAQKNKYGEYSAADIIFMNDLDDYIKTHCSMRIKIGFMAYQATQKAPHGLTCHDDVIPIVAPIGCRWNHSFYEVENSSAVGENGYIYDNDFAQIIKDWDSCSSEYITYSYQIGNANTLFPYNTFDVTFDQYRFFYNNGSSTMLGEGDWCDSGSGFIALKDYLDSKALVDVNGSFDEYYEKFFQSYYGVAGPYMQQLFDECINAVDFLADNYGRGTSYNPTNHKTEVGTTHYYDGSIGIDDDIAFSEFWDNSGDCYNGSNGGNGDNIANISNWISLCNSAISAVSDDPVALKHVKRECIFVYYANYQINGDSTYNSTLCQYAYDVGTYWINETNMRTDGYNGLDGENTICYELFGVTFRTKYMS